MRKKRFIILDRDGTVIFDRDHLTEVSQVELIPNAAKAIKKLNELGLGVIVVTNQTVIGNKHISLRNLKLIHKKMLDLLSNEGATIDRIYFCPHKKEDNCSCRKPKTGLIDRALEDYHFDAEECFVIGDNKGDIELGKNIGAKTILVRTGYGRQLEKEGLNPDYIVDTLEAVLPVIKDELTKKPQDISQLPL